MAVGHHLSEAFAGAVLFVDFGMLSDPDLVATAIASMLGLPVGSDDARPSLIAYLRDKRVLLILDTCEHLIDAVARLPRASSRPRRRSTSWRPAARPCGSKASTSTGWIRCLSAGRSGDDRGGHPVAFRRRNCSSSARWRAAPASISAMPTRPSSPASAESSTAWRSRSSWRPGGSRAYGLQQTAALLDQHLTLLWPGSRTAPPRQKTLQATLDWSFGLLVRAWNAWCFAGSPIFVGHFTLDAALEVVASADLDRSTVFGAIDSLVAKSMVATRPIGAMMRYRLLDTTRAYALEIEVDDAERADLAARHAAYYRRWLEQFGADWPTLSTGTERAPHFAALNNVRAALEWCFGAEGNVEIGVGLAAAAAPVFLAMSLMSECHRWSERAMLALDDAARRSPRRCISRRRWGFPPCTCNGEQ